MTVKYYLAHEPLNQLGHLSEINQCRFNAGIVFSVHLNVVQLVYLRLKWRITK